MEQEISSYEQQAIDFLTNAGAMIEVTYLKTGKHFDDDKEERDIYTVTITNKGGRKYTFNFGNSIRNSGKYIIRYPYLKKELGRLFCSDSEKQKLLTKVVGYSERKTVSEINEHYSKPSSYDVLAAITKYDPGTFEDFCSEFGYDTDSKKAEKTYLAVKDEYLNISRLFSEDELTQMQEIN